MSPKPLFVLSPCGTSLLTNQAQDAAERKLVSSYANAKNPNEIPSEDLTKLESLIKRVEEQIVQADLNLASKMSAELNGIIKLYEGQFNNNRDQHYLISTDTWLGENTAKLVEKWLETKRLNVQVNRQTYLQTKDITSFQFALSEIVGWCEETLRGYQPSYHIVFNLTGGFKSVQGFLQTLATYYADETIYIFETANDLLRIPRLPVEIVPEESVRENLEIFRRLSMNLSTATTTSIPETLVMKMYGKIDLSPWGELVWNNTKSKIYGEKLYPSPSKLLEYGPNFKRSVEGIASDRLVLVNSRIDQLAKCLEEDGNYNPSTLDFKQLRNNPCPPSTHELDAWADGNAQRIFGHYEGNIFILDKLGLHLR